MFFKMIGGKMSQAGIHALVGPAIRKITPTREWLMLGIILGSLFPDLDNFAVTVATLAKLQTVGHGLHRTFTHSIAAVLAVVLIFFFVAQLLKQPRWTTLGVGLGVGILLHIVLDLLIWFNGVELLWPLGGWVNLWAGVNPPAWFSKLMDPLEFLFFALFFAWLYNTARLNKTDLDFLGTLRVWTIAMVVLLVIFTPLAYLMGKGFQTFIGLFYLISITAAFVITIRMRQTVEAFN
jgi:membrane-bound metal-dependent hydrolase YbcI (DUF457 family)